MYPTDSDKESHSDALAALIARAGARTTLPDGQREQVRLAARDAWQHSLRERRQRRGLLAAAVAAPVLALTLALIFHGRTTAPAAPGVLAQLLYTRGDIQLHSTYPPGAVAGDSSRTRLRAGDEIVSGSDGGARIRLSSGVGLRVDANTELRWHDVGKLELLRGSVYIDSGEQHAALALHTRFGDVSHLGTRYLVRTDSAGLHVVVRDGRVTLASGATHSEAGAHERLDVGSEGQVLRASAAACGEEWLWADSLGPRFDIDGHSLDELVAWVNREGCQPVQYADPGTRAAAAKTVLHGGNAASPDQALDAVLLTTDFSARVVGDHVVISRH